MPDTDEVMPLTYGVNEWPTKFAVSCLPPDNPSHRHFTLWVEWRGSDRWAVSDGFAVMGLDGEFIYEPLPSERSDEWKARHQFDRETALRLAREQAPLITVNGITVADALERIKPAAVSAPSPTGGMRT